MPATTQIIELPADATLAAVQRQLARAQMPRVLLVLPAGSRALANPARLQLIHRQARRADLEVALVTTHAPTRRLARAANLSVFGSVRRAERARRWRRSHAAPPLPAPSGARRADPPHRVGHGRGRTSNPLIRRSPPDLPDRTEPRWARWAEALRLLAFLVICLVGLAALMLFVVPVATVNLVAPQQEVSVTVPVLAAVGVEEVDYPGGQVPARLVQTRVEGNGTISTTGRRYAPEDPATGRVVLINRRDTEVKVPELTVVGTSTGVNVRFQITEPVTVPAGIGAAIEAPVRAMEPGTDGNVPAFTVSRIEGPLSVALRVTNDQPTAGGTEREVGVVTEADKDALRTSLLAEVRQASYQRLGGMLREGEYVPPDSVQTFVMAETFDRFSGEDSDMLGLRLELLARGLAVDTRAAEELAERALVERVPADVQLMDGTTQFARGPLALPEGSEEQASFEVTASARVVGSVDTGAVRQAIRGTELPEALAILKRDFELGAEPRLSLRPDWLGRVPWLPLRIHVRVADI